MKLTRQKITLFLLGIGISVISLMLFTVNNVFAASENDNVGFTINAIHPENQIDKNNTFFNLRMTPGQKQTIEVNLINTSNIDSEYTVSVNQAYTNKQGFIDYADSNVKPDSSQKYPINDLISYEKEVKVSAGESFKIPFEIQMPEEQYDGEILAAIQITKKQDRSSSDAVSNQVGYVLGLKLTETDTPVKREIQLENVKASAIYGKATIAAKLKNPTMDAIGKLKYVVEVKDQKTGKKIKQATFDSSMEMAPNSTYDFYVDLGEEGVVSGDYVMNLVITDAKNNEWKFNEKFQITAKEARDVNKVTVDVGKTVIPMWIYLIIGAAILLVIVAIVVLILKRKKKKEEVKKKEKMKKNGSKRDPRNANKKIGVQQKRKKSSKNRIKRE